MSPPVSSPILLTMTSIYMRRYNAIQMRWAQNKIGVPDIPWYFWYFVTSKQISFIAPT